MSAVFVKSSSPPEEAQLFSCCVYGSTPPEGAEMSMKGGIAAQILVAIKSREDPASAPAASSSYSRNSMLLSCKIFLNEKVEKQTCNMHLLFTILDPT